MTQPIPAAPPVTMIVRPFWLFGFFQPNMPNQLEDKDSITADIEFANVFMRFLARALAKGTISGHPRVEKGLQKLQRGEARGVK
jgi:hypothetical protein